jgi:transposase
MDEFSKYVGLDLHKETIAVSMADAGGGEARFFGEIANKPEAVAKLARQLGKGGERLSFCYEAGACGYGVYRQLRGLKHDCVVVAPSLIPKKVGDRVKTDRRDSLLLARLHRAHELTAVWVPEGAQEALRDLTRGREDLKHLQRQVKQRLQAFLLRHGKRYSGKSRWTQAHSRWLETVKCDHPVQQIVFQEYVDTLGTLTQRVKALDQHIEIASRESVFWPVIEALMALRGVNLLSATTVVAEIGDLRRFAGAPQLMAYLGVVPSEHSSGGRQSRGGITKTGNGHVRECWSRLPGLTVTRPGRAPYCSDAPSVARRRYRPSPGKRRRACASATGSWRARANSRCKCAPRSPASWPASSGRSGKHYPGQRRRHRAITMNVKCVGSRMGNGGRILEVPTRRPATE